MKKHFQPVPGQFGRRYIMKRQTSKRPTISQVAERAGVSAGTVSNYLNGTVAVSPDRSARIQEAIDSLHYVPDPSASSLRRKEARDIFVLTPDLNNVFYTKILGTYMDCAYKEGYNISISSYEYSRDLEKRILSRLASARKGSLVVIFNGFGDEDLIESLIRSDIRVILADRNRTIAGASSLSFDNENVMFDLVRCLKEKGYRKIALFTEPLILENIRRRHDSFLKAMRYHGYSGDGIRVFLDETLVLNKMNQGYRYMQRLLQEQKREELPDAWIASSDNLAIGILRAITEAGYQVPGDFGLVGFDNLDVSEYIQPALTTVNQDQVYFGSRLWEISKRVLKTNECINDTIMQNLIIRSSC